MLYYCTYFDRNYLSRGLAMYRSLLRHSGPFTLWILCLDDETHRVLARLDQPAIRAIRLRDLEAHDPALLATKNDRSTIEYYFTCTPCFPAYVLAVAPEIQAITYLDADLLFYSDPSGLAATTPGRSITIIPHRFPDRLRHLEMYGVYNVSLVSFRNDEEGRGCLGIWRDQCLDWCFDRIDQGRYADQRYLDAWPSRFSGVDVIDDPGAGLGPWNFMRYSLNFGSDTPLVDGRPLVFYHFQGFRYLGRKLYDLGLSRYGRMSWGTKRRLYGGYVDELEAVDVWLRQRGAQSTEGAPSIRNSGPSLKRRMLTLVRGQLMLSVGPVKL